MISSATPSRSSGCTLRRHQQRLLMDDLKLVFIAEIIPFTESITW